MKVLTRKELNKIGWDSEKILLSRRIAFKQLIPNYRLDGDVMLKSINCPDNIHLYLYSKELDLIIGHFFAARLNPETEAKVINGTFDDDNDIRAENFIPIKGKSTIYFSSLSLNRDHQNVSNLRTLCEGIVSCLADLCEQGIEIERFIARGMSESGQKVCERLGMKKVIKHREKGIIYALDPKKPERITPLTQPFYDAWNKSQKISKK
jgi:hypothetical protein